jgi:hypothetical protein
LDHQEFIIVILLHLVLIKETKAKADVIEMKDMWSGTTTFGDAVENCAQRPTRTSKVFSANPPVSQ